MTAKLYKNISIVQIPVQQGVSEYQFPKNVDWAGQEIQQILLAAPSSDNCLSPIDGQTPVLSYDKISDLYFDLYAEDKTEITQSMYFENILHTANYPVEINSVLSLTLSTIKFTTAPTADGVLLLYVFWGGRKDGCYDLPRRSVTIAFPLAANEKLSFRQLINTYMHADYDKVRGIAVWDAENNPCYITLRDHQLSYMIKSMYGGLARPQMEGATAQTSQVHPLYLDSIDIDFDYSFVRNATGTANNQKITIYY